MRVTADSAAERPNVSIHAAERNVSPSAPEARNDHPPMRNNAAFQNANLSP
ncbi:hypothetical protein [Streptomyces fradiae]|uniref:hypothetical protein n=1 Tax=Streptomyces fradiae TaxID=1906 RepID=UPI0035BE587B